jgi:NAD+ dependent glucose-6-phosphate dehydrogenase
MTDPKKLLITGAAGLIGTNLRRYWGSRYELRLADITPVAELGPHEQFVQFDIADLSAFRTASEDTDTVVHLAADPSMQAEFYESLLTRNVIGAYNAFEAARLAGCRRLIFASSINCILGYRGQLNVPCDVPVWPQNVYGATKCWGEALARVYADQHGLSCICVRIGGARYRQDGPWDPERISGGISARDQAQLFACCVDAPDDVRFKIINGTSNHKRSWMSLLEARELGYEPEDGTAFPKEM